MENELQPYEKEVARRLWLDLKNGVQGAPKQLNRTSERIRAAILSELLRAMKTREKSRNPFD